MKNETSLQTTLFVGLVIFIIFYLIFVVTAKVVPDTSVASSNAVRPMNAQECTVQEVIGRNFINMPCK